MPLANNLHINKTKIVCTADINLFTSHTNCNVYIHLILLFNDIYVLQTYEATTTVNIFVHRNSDVTR